MCNDYRSRVAFEAIYQGFSHLKIPLVFPQGKPNIEPREDIRISDRAAAVRATAGASRDGGEAELVMLRWSWPGPGGKPVYNFRSEGRRFGPNRCLIPADGFYEFTTPAVEPGAPRPKLKIKWLFTHEEEPWFAIAGIWQASAEGDAFTMLTTEPGADVAPYHNRQIVVLPRARWGAWLGGEPAEQLLGPSPAGTFKVERVER